MVATTVGIFEVQNMPFAVSVETVAEVVPFQSVTPIFAAHESIIGGLNLRGWVVPIIDLISFVTGKKHEVSQPTILILIKDDRMLAVAIDNVIGMYDLTPEEIASVDNNELLNGMFVSRDTALTISLLNCERLFSGSQLPVTSVRNLPDCDMPVSDEVNLTSALIFRVGQRIMAVESVHIFSTLASSKLTNKPRSNDCYLGEIQHLDKLIPALDFGCLIFAEPATDPCHQGPAVIISLGDKQVALCIDEVIDVIDINTGAAISKPAQSFSGSDWFSKVMPASALPAEIKDLLPSGQQLLLMLDVSYMQTLDTIQGTLNLCRTVAEEHPASSTTAHLSKSLRQGLYFDMGAIMVIDMAKVTQLFTTSKNIIPLDDKHYMVGMLQNEKTSLAVYDVRGFFKKSAGDYASKETGGLKAEERLIVVEDEQGAFALWVNALLDVIQYVNITEDTELSATGNAFPEDAETVKFMVEGKPKYATMMTVAALRKLITPPVIS